ncbi:MAG: molybdenum cofactor biosynthesis protein MoaE [Rhodospirillaceae bacterium]|nr:molybdenum cofactor biosynthesis protein MoaE [Rhodospirillaceae bacterium]
MSVSVQEADFDVAAEIQAVTAGRCDIGGLAVFIGLVRDLAERADGDPPGSMTLEHYPGMTERQIEEIEAEANVRWPLLATRVVHRVGRLEPGDRIVLVIAASAHRAAAFDACQFLIDWLKTRAPFWKLEQAGDAPGRWVDARASDEDAAARWQGSPPTAG